MPHLLITLKGYRIKYRSIFLRKLEVYDEYVVFKRRSWFKTHELSITYSHITQVNLQNGIIFSTLELVSSSGIENILIKHVFRKEAKKAKKIIERKIHLAHNRSSMSLFKKQPESSMHEVERSLDRLRELVQRGKISKREYNKRRERLVKDID